MTEEIIIDGVNVAGCEFFDNGEVKNACLLGYREDAVNNFTPNCNDNTYCYYKQLKCLEQENKELKTYIESNKQQVEEAEMLVMDNDRLQQEVENLKDTIYYDVEKYRSALEEIRTYLNTLSSIDSDFTNTETYLRIQDKINEVLNLS